MAIETQVQRSLLNFMVDELGYEEKKSNTIGFDLLIESDVQRCLQSPPNQRALKLAMKKSGMSLPEFVAAYCHALSSYLYQGMNVAVKIRRNNFKFKFYGEDFYLFYPSGSDLSDYSEFNVYSVSEEVVYKHPVITDKGAKYHRRFDLCMFVNGMFLSMVELKHVTSGQDVGKGKEKIIGNYFEAIKHFGEVNGHIPLRNESNIEFRDFLKVFESSIHVVASDLSTTLVARSLRELRTPIKALIEKNKGSSVFSRGEEAELASAIFNHVPVPETIHNPLDKMRFVLRQLYAKPYVERELVFYNYQETNVNNNVPRLISPRPKQKYGVDKTIDRIIELYTHEDDPDFIANELGLRLRQRGYSEEQIRQEVQARRLLTNNDKIYSILKQYAAGFGKTKIMSWEAIMLNEMTHPKKPREKLFDKIILLSDRIDLKQQMAITMKDMPTVKRGAWGEADTVQQFASMLNDPVCRIVVVNVQKFNFLTDKLSTPQKRHCATLRIAFIVDEIHRSHNGAQNERMQAVFDTMGRMAGGGKKNLLIGLTATISDVIMRRFGEVAMPSSKGFEFVPFDAFTMDEAIRGGYVLDPTQKFIPIHVPVFVDVMDEFAEDEYKMPSGKDVYQDDEYIGHVVNHAYLIIKAKTFPAIRGRGKAMFVADSVDSAISAFHQFKELIVNDPTYAESEKAPKVYIVFSDSGGDQHYRESMRMLNGGLSEKEIINRFKVPSGVSKNAIMVVVDKLQTGFDEPTLHTLVLNTERRGIEMVQTLCRVNRTVKGKTDCMVLDYSMRDPKTGRSKNELNMISAFQKYAGMAVSVYNVSQRQAMLKNAYEEMMNNKTFSELFELYKRSKRDEDVDLTQLQPRVSALSDDEVGEVFALGRDFARELGASDRIFNFSDKYKNRQIPDFFRTIRNIYDLLCGKKKRKTLRFDVSDIEGYLVAEVLEQVEGRQASALRERKKSVKQGDGDAETRKEKFLAKVRDFNAYNEDAEELLLQTDVAIVALMQNVMDMAKSNLGTSGSKAKSLINSIRTNMHNDNYDQFLKVFGGVARRVKRENPFVKEHHDKLMMLMKDLKEFYYFQFAQKVVEDWS